MVTGPDFVPIQPDEQQNLVLYPAPYGQVGFDPYRKAGDRWLYEEYGGDSRVLGLALLRDSVLSRNDLSREQQDRMHKRLLTEKGQLQTAYVGLEELSSMADSDPEVVAGREVYQVTINGIQRFINRQIKHIPRP